MYLLTESLPLLILWRVSHPPRDIVLGDVKILSGEVYTGIQVYLPSELRAVGEFKILNKAKAAMKLKDGRLSRPHSWPNNWMRRKVVFLQDVIWNPKARWHAIDRYNGSGSVLLESVGLVNCDIMPQDNQHAYHPAVLDVGNNLMVVFH